MRLACLAGGVGAARFLEGLVRVVPPKDVTIIVNTGDDVDFYGLHVSPDIDIVMYTLAGIVDEAKGWGVKGDSFKCLEVLGRYGYETWFMLGDADLATHIHRTLLMRRGLTLSEATRRLCLPLGVEADLIPMSDDRVETRVATDMGVMNFQEYLVKLKAQPKVLGVMFNGIDEAKPAPRVLESIARCDGVIICPSNPIVSIGPIISLKGVREALRKCRAKVVGVSPIVGGAPVKGPADRLMRGLGLEVSAYSVAALYKDFLGGFVIDTVDEALKGSIESLGIKVSVTKTVMGSLKNKESLARAILNLLNGLRRA